MEDVFKALGKYRIESEKVSGDGVSNVVIIDRLYKIPFRLFQSRSKFLDDFYALDGKEFCSDRVRVACYAVGWGDCECKTFLMKFIVVPNGGKAIYGYVDIERLEEV